MKPGRQWIHFDAHFPLAFGYDLLERFGPAGQLLFIQFLCACKRSFPQGQIQYRTDDEARILLGAPYPFVDNQGNEWTLDGFWKWCGYRRITTTSRRNGIRIVTASRWMSWERTAASSLEAERKRRSRAKKPRKMSGQTSGVSAMEVGGWRGEVGGVRGEVGGGMQGGNPPTRPAAIAILERLQNQNPPDPPPISDGPCARCGFVQCECPLEPHEVSEVLRANGWRREGPEGEWLPPNP